jgi:hypothetical protein
MPLKEQSVKKQAISKYYFSIASIKSSKESSNYNKIICFAGVNDTGEALEKSNISANIRKKSKSSLGLPTGARRSCLKKTNRGEKSGGTVPLRHWAAVRSQKDCSTGPNPVHSTHAAFRMMADNLENDLWNG